MANEIPIGRTLDGVIHFDQGGCCKLAESIDALARSHYPMTLGTFDGTDVLSFPRFAKDFERHFGAEGTTTSNRVTDAERCHYLNHYTAGEAKAAIEHCLWHSDSSVAFRRAMERLRDRYDSPDVVLEAFAAKFAGMQVRTSRDCRVLASLVAHLDNRLEDMGRDRLVDVTLNPLARDILLKLPRWTLMRWAEQKVKLEEAEGGAEFGHLASFLEREATVMKHLEHLRSSPTASPLNDNPPPPPPPQHTQRHNPDIRRT